MKTIIFYFATTMLMAFTKSNVYTNILVIISSCLMINMFADMLGEFLSKLGKKLGLSPAVRGALFEGVSSSIPELLTSVVAALAVLGTFSGKPDVTAFADIGIGTIGGSAIFNILIIPFLSILVTPKDVLNDIEIDKKAMLRDVLVYACSIGLLAYGAYTGVINSKIGMVMTVLYIGYVFVMLRMDGNNNIIDEEEMPKESNITLIVLSILTLIPIGFAVHNCVTSAAVIGEVFNIPRIVMSLIVLAATTSIPDTLLSIKSAKNGELDASIANAVGSNSFDILICLGAVLAFSGISVNVNFYEVAYIFGFLILAAVCYTLAFLFNTGKSFKLAMLGAPYAGFVGYIFLMLK